MAFLNNPTPLSWRRNFFTLWSGQAISLFGSALVQFAVVWWLTTTTGSATVLAVATMCALLPAVLLGPFTGVVVDRASRGFVMLVADGVVAAATLVLAFLFWRSAVELWQIYCVLLVRSAAGSFQLPAMQASTTLMVPAAQLARVAGLNQMLQGLMGVMAPLTGASLIGLLSMPVILMLDVVTALLGVLALLLADIPRPVARTMATAASYLSDLRTGWAWLVSRRGLLVLIGTAAFINFMAVPAVSLTPILVTKHFGGGVLHLATMESVFSAGLLVGGIVLAAWGGFRERMLTVLLGLVMLGAALVGIGLLPSSAFWVAVVLAFCASAMIAIVNGPIMAILQATVAPDVQGRVFGLLGSLASAVAPLSLLVAGPVADTLGVQAWYIAGGVSCVLMAVALYLAPAVRHLEQTMAAPATTEPTHSAQSSAT